jgi:chromosome partitioning protein
VPGLYRRPISHYALAAMQELHTFNIPVLAHLPLGVVMNEAAARGMPVTTFAPETIQAVAFREIANTLEWYREQSTGGTIVPTEDEFAFEDFIADVSAARTANDNGSRKKLYDFMPKRPRPPQ